MSSSATEIREAKALFVNVSEDTLSIDIEDGRTVSVPLSWYPRLLHANAQERGRWEICGGGIHWPDLDEDISVDALLKGYASSESQVSLRKWLAAR